MPKLKPGQLGKVDLREIAAKKPRCQCLGCKRLAHVRIYGHPYQEPFNVCKPCARTYRNLPLSQQEF